MAIIATTIGDLYTEDKGDVDMEEVPGLYSEDSSSKMPIPSSSPERPQPSFHSSQKMRSPGILLQLVKEKALKYSLRLKTFFKALSTVTIRHVT